MRRRRRRSAADSRLRPRHRSQSGRRECSPPFAWRASDRTRHADHRHSNVVIVLTIFVRLIVAVKRFDSGRGDNNRSIRLSGVDQRVGPGIELQSVQDDDIGRSSMVITSSGDGSKSCGSAFAGRIERTSTRSPPTCRARSARMLVEVTTLNGPSARASIAGIATGDAKAGTASSCARTAQPARASRRRKEPRHSSRSVRRESDLDMDRLSLLRIRIVPAPQLRHRQTILFETLCQTERDSES